LGREVGVLERGGEVRQPVAQGRRLELGHGREILFDGGYDLDRATVFSYAREGTNEARDGGLGCRGRAVAALALRRELDPARCLLGDRHLNDVAAGLRLVD